MEDLARKGSKRVIFDLSGVDYIDIGGMGMVALASGKLKELADRWRWWHPKAACCNC